MVRLIQRCRKGLRNTSQDHQKNQLDSRTPQGLMQCRWMVGSSHLIRTTYSTQSFGLGRTCSYCQIPYDHCLSPNWSRISSFRQYCLGWILGQLNWILISQDRSLRKIERRTIFNYDQIRKAMDLCLERCLTVLQDHRWCFEDFERNWQNLLSLFGNWIKC